MSFRIRKKIKLNELVSVNFSKSGASFSAGVPGFVLNLSRKWLTWTVGAPGTGISYRGTTIKGAKP